MSNTPWTLFALLVVISVTSASLPLMARFKVDVEELGSREELERAELEERAGPPRLQCLTCEGEGTCTFRRLRCARGERCIAFNDGKKFFYGCAAPVICEHLGQTLTRSKCCDTDNCNWDL